MDSESPPCGFYRTVADIGDIPVGRFVYYHNHGDPGAGVFLPSGWKGNRAEFQSTGQLLATADATRYLEPLAAEGFYRVVQQFHCCDNHCRLFDAETLVQLGYDDAATPILFVPEWRDGSIFIPEEGTQLDRGRIELMSPLKVAELDDPT